MKIQLVILLFCSSLFSLNLFADGDLQKISCQDYENLVKGYMFFSKEAKMAFKAIGELCQSNPRVVVHLSIHNEQVEINKQTTLIEPKKEEKKNTKINFNGNYKNDSKEYLLVSSVIEYSTLSSPVDRWVVKNELEYKIEDEENYFKGALTVKRDRLINDGLVIFSIVEVSRDDYKKQRVVAKGLIGTGYDFTGDYFGINDKGVALKVSTSLGYQYEDVDESRLHDIISITRLKVIKDLTDSLRAELEVWFEAPVDSVVDDFNISSELKLVHKGFLKGLFNSENVDLVSKVGYYFDNGPASGVEKDEFVVMIGIEVKTAIINRIAKWLRK